MKSIKILLADDNLIVRRPLKKLLNNYNDLKVVGECFDEKGLIMFLELNPVDVILMDITMELMNSYETTKRIKEHYTDTKIVGFSFMDHIYYINKMITSGADGFISKFDVNQEIITSELRRVVDYRD